LKLSKHLYPSLLISRNPPAVSSTDLVAAEHVRLLTLQAELGARVGVDELGRLAEPVEDGREFGALELGARGPGHGATAHLAGRERQHGRVQRRVVDGVELEGGAEHAQELLAAR